MITLQRCLIYLTIAMTFLVCQRTDSSTYAPEPLPYPATDSVDYTVYSAIIDQYCSNQQAEKQLFIIAPQTVKAYVNDWQNVLKEDRPDSVSANPAWQQFVSTLDSSKFKTQSLNRSIPSACYRTQTLTDQQWTYYFKSSASTGIEGLRKDFPGFSSQISFSSVAYSADGKKAVCYRSSVCGGLCGTGDLYFLERKSMGWRVASSRLVWIS